MTYLYIPQTAWQEAEAYFAQHPDVVKFKRQTPNAHSFVKLTLRNGETRILALARGKDVTEGVLGEGAFARVKIGQDKWGNQFAVKIEGDLLRDEKQGEIKILASLNIFEGFASRFLGQYKIYKKAFTMDKFYTAMQKYEGQNLESKLWVMQAGQRTAHRLLSRLERLKIAQKCCQAIQKCHEKNIAHCDIKPSNFMHTETLQGEMLIYLVDFGFAKQLPPMEHIVWGVAGGTPAYMAPELLPPVQAVNKKARLVPFSKSADIFSLGKLFEIDLQLDPHLWRDMVALHPNNRIGINTILERLDQAIRFEVQTNPKKDKIVYNRIVREPVLFFSRAAPPHCPHNLDQAFRRLNIHG